MPARSPIGRRARLRRLALGCTLLASGAAWPLAVHGRDGAATAISIGEPAGFAGLTEPRTLLADVYFGGERRGEARITTAPGSIAFDDPEALLALLPALTDPETVAAALAAGDLAANAHLACSTTSDPARCGRLSPAVVGVIFDRDRFRLDVFLNPRFVAVSGAAEPAFVPEPQKGLAMINQIAAVVSGNVGTATRFYNFQNNLVLASGARRLRANLSYANDLGFGAERVALEWDRPGLRYSAGALWAPGSELAGHRKLIGIGIESQIDTRLDRDKMLGSPIVVFLDQRARVDVIRDGRVLYSAIYEAGNQEIDTSGLPDGSYDVILRIDEPGRPAREERRFFSKSRRVPSLGRTDFFAFAGVLVDGARTGSLDPSDRPYLQGGVAHRLAENWAISGGVEASELGASAEVAATYITPIALIRAAGVADDEGTYGGILQVASAGTSRLSFNFDLRHIEADAAAIVAAPPVPVAPIGGIGIAGNLGSYSQANGVVSYSIANLRFLGSFAYRDEEIGRARYSIGPSVEWDVLRHGPFVLTLRGDATATERGSIGFAGLQLRMLGGRSTFSALGGARATSIAGDDVGEGAVAALAGSLSRTLGDGELSLGAGYEHQPRQDSFVASTEYRHRFVTAAGDLSHNERASGDVTQYALGLQTTLAAGAGALEIAGETTSDSLIVARVDGAREGDRFDVLVNEQVVGTIDGRATFTHSLPSYRAYDVRIRSTGDGLLAYDSAARRVGLYPGTVARLDWRAAPITIKFGRLVAPDGTPVGGASITGKGIWSETDDQGYFQIEVPEGAELSVTTRDGSSYAMTLPEGEVTDGIARLGPVACCERRDVRLGALN